MFQTPSPSNQRTLEELSHRTEDNETDKAEDPEADIRSSYQSAQGFTEKHGFRALKTIDNKCRSNEESEVPKFLIKKWTAIINKNYYVWTKYTKRKTLRGWYPDSSKEKTTGPHLQNLSDWPIKIFQKNTIH